MAITMRVKMYYSNKILKINYITKQNIIKIILLWVFYQINGKPQNIIKRITFILTYHELYRDGLNQTTWYGNILRSLKL